jgi:tRNA dimethylallyltransferase
VVGPTASGKTALVTALAALTDIEVVSADSRQVYRGLDVGTAKPSAEDRAAAPYHGLDVADPDERWSAGRFARDAAAWIAGIRERGRLPVVAGGTGFYLRALFDGLFAEPPLDPARREPLRARLAAMPPGVLARWAARLDPGFRGGGAQRAARAVEIALLAGRPLSVLQRETPGPASGLRPWYGRLGVARDVLAGRIAARADAMVRGGIVEETQRLLAAGVPAGAPGLSGVGYPETVAMLEGRLPRAALAGAIAAATRRYAKRQETWFRHQLRGPVLDLDGRADPRALAQTFLAAYRAATT